jgi:holin-like protein
MIYRQSSANAVLQPGVACGVPCGFLDHTSPSMLGTFTLLLVFQLVGEIIAQGLSLPIPGPVIGMALLFLAIAVRGGHSDAMRQTAQNLLQHLSLLFVPAGTGVMLHFHRVAEEWLPLLASLVISTAATLAVTALVLRAMSGSGAKEGP